MARRVIGWAAIAFCLVVAHFAGAQDVCGTGIDYVGQGQASYSYGDYANALGAFSCAIQEDATNYQAYVGRFQAALLAGDYGLAVRDANAVKDNAQSLFDTALMDYNMRLSMDNSDIQAYMLRALLYWTMTQDDLVLQDCERILQLDPQNAFAYLLRGSSNQYLGDRLTPPADFTQALLLDPDNADIYALIGSTYVQTGDNMNALMHLDRAIQIDPANARSYYFRGLIYVEERDYLGAITQFSSAVEFDPQYIDAYYDRAWTYARLQNYPQAINDFENAISRNDRFSLAYVGRGNIHDLMGNPQAAVRDFMHYVQLNQTETFAGEALAAGVPVSLNMASGRVYTLQFSAQAGQRVSIVASSPANRADPLIVLLNTDGTTPLVGNDDEVAGNFTAAIRDFSVPANGTYILLVTHSDGGDQGMVEVNVTVE